MVGGSMEGLEESWPLPKATGRAEGLRRVIHRGSLGVGFAHRTYSVGLAQRLRIRHGRQDLGTQ